MPHASLLVIVLLARASALLPLASSQSRVGTRLRAATADGLGEWFDQRDVSDERLHVSSTPSLAGALAELWDLISADGDDGPMTSPQLLLLPQCEALNDGDARTMQLLLEHLESCKDVCERFGSELTVMPLHPRFGGGGRAPCAGFAVRSIKSSSSSSSSSERGGGLSPELAAKVGMLGGDSDDEDFELSSGLSAKLAALGGDDEDDAIAPAAAADAGVCDESDEELLTATRAWSDAVISGMGVCPFSVDADRAGLPLGRVHYPICRASDGEAVYAAFWHEVDRLRTAPPRELSTTLLITPAFGSARLEGYDEFAGTLTQVLEPLRFEEDIQLVFFHPLYVFRDGHDRLGDGGAANFARRSPFPMINILRTPQVRFAHDHTPARDALASNNKRANCDDAGARRSEGAANRPRLRAE